MAEHLIQYSCDRLRLPISVAHLSYAPNPAETRTVFKSSDWLQSLVVGSLHIRAIPETLGSRWGHIDWIPSNFLSRVLVELALYDDSVQASSMQTHSPVNIHPRDWTFVREIVVDELQRLSGYKLQIIPLRQWIDVIQDKENSPIQDKVTRGFNPALRFVDLYSTMLRDEPNPIFPDAVSTAKRSPSLSRIPAVQEDWIRKWVREWLDD